MASLLQHDEYHLPPTDADREALGDLEYWGPIYGIDKLLIGVTGEKGHGKDTVCARLAAFGYERHAWADELKAIACHLWDLSPEQAHGTIEQKEAIDERWGVASRHFFQILGTDVARKGHAETWIRFLLLKLARLSMKGPELPTLSAGYAVSDLRFPNEADAIRQHGGIIVRVVRDFRTGVGENHASERGVRKIKADYVLVNDSTVGDLHGVVDDFARIVQARGFRGAKDYLWYIADLTDPHCRAVPLGIVQHVGTTHPIATRTFTWAKGEPLRLASPLMQEYFATFETFIPKLDTQTYRATFSSPHTNVFFGDPF